MGGVWDVLRAGLSICSELVLGCNVVSIMCNSLIYLWLLLHPSLYLTLTSKLGILLLDKDNSGVQNQYNFISTNSHRSLCRKHSNMCA